VLDVHDVHIWTLTSGMEVGSAHLEVNAECDPAVVLSTAQQLLTDRHQLGHFTLQVEPPGSRIGCRELSW
jgi:cobalt-zinc-cadmium efflux system protein